MPTGVPRGTRTLRTGRELLVHQALLYGSDEEFAEAARGFLEEGRKKGDALVAIAPPRRLKLLRMEGLEEHDAFQWFQTPPRAIWSAVSVARERWWRHGRVSVVAEPVWHDENGALRSPGEIREWKRYEALLNVVFAHTATRLLCAYDTRTTPADVLRDALRTHHGERYEDPAEIYAECNRAPLLPPVEPVAHRGFMRGELPSLRDFTSRAAAAFGLYPTMPLVMAVNEVATNIIKHGGGRGSLWVWSDGAEVICDLIDPGSIVPDRFLGFIPPEADQPTGAGMWAVRQLCELVEIRSGPTGTVFRLHVRLSPV